MKKFLFIVFLFLVGSGWIYSQEIHIYTPSAGSWFTSGGPITIGWHVYGIDSGTVKILLYHRTGSHYWTLKSNHPFDETPVELQIPSYIPADKYMIRVAHRNNIGDNRHIHIGSPGGKCNMKITDFQSSKAVYIMPEDLVFNFTVQNKGSNTYRGEIQTLINFLGEKKSVGTYLDPHDFTVAPQQSKRLSYTISSRGYLDGYKNKKLPRKHNLQLELRFTQKNNEPRCMDLFENTIEITVWDSKVTDLEIVNCSFRDKNSFVNGERPIVMFTIKNLSEAAASRFRVKAWSVVGKPTSRGHVSLRGNVNRVRGFSRRTLEKGDSITDDLWIGINEKRAGDYTLYLRVDPVNPPYDSNSSNNQCFLVYKVLYEYEKTKQPGQFVMRTPNLIIEDCSFSNGKITAKIVNIYHPFVKIKNKFKIGISFIKGFYQDGTEIKKTVDFPITESHLNQINNNGYFNFNYPTPFYTWTPDAKAVLFVDSSDDIKEIKEDDNLCETVIKWYAKPILFKTN